VSRYPARTNQSDATTARRSGAPRRHIPAKQQRVHRGALLVCDLSHL